MESSVKSEYIEQVKKLITRECSAKCFVKNSENCIDNCYESYLVALNVTTKTLQQIGYSRNSRYIHLAYGEEFNEYDRITKFNDLPADSLGFSTPYLEKYYFHPEREI